MRNALAAYSDVADIVYIEVPQAYVAADLANPQLGMRAYADLTILTYNGTPGTGLLGRHSPPDEGNEGQGEYNRLGPGWNAQGLAPGGFSFVTLIHELGHGHGLAHPHDTGGNSSILRGVEEEGVAFDYTTGDFDLNQAIHTVMSYEDGWPLSPYGNASTSAGFGYQTGLSAFDIAVIQDKYGVNEEFRTGDDVYVLPEANAVATFNPDGSLATKATGYTTIWDAGGNDTISYTGTRNATIDLREATLRYEIGGGGWMSYTTGATPVYAGFTIANGAVIENATSGSGNDTLRGNAASNYFDSGDGDDIIYLQDGGSDVAIGRGGNDGFYFGAAYNGDLVDGGAGNLDQIGLQGDYSAGVTLGSMTGVELVVVLAGNDARFGGATGTSLAYNLVADASTIVSNNKLTIQANALRAGESVTLNAAASGIDFLVYGGLGTDNLTGGSGDDGFFFGQGRLNAGDILNGGGGTLDQIGLQGNFTGANALVFGAGQISAIEFIVMLSAVDSRFGGQGGTAAYDLTMNDGNVAGGQRLIISANTLKAGETLTFNGAAETNGSFRIFSGAGDDVITGGQNGDEIFGGLGNDTFRYTSAEESAANDRDAIKDFRSGDTIDLSALAANNGLASFQFIGSGAQSGAGQIRVVQTGGQATVEIYVDGDAMADLVIDVTVADGHALTASDFDMTAMEPGSGTVILADEASSARESAKPDTFDLDSASFGAMARAGVFGGTSTLSSLPDLVSIELLDEIHLSPTNDFLM